MNKKHSEAKYELKHLKRWKGMKHLLIKTKEELYKMQQGITYDSNQLPGGNHSTIHAKMQKAIEERDQYQNIIDCYSFVISRLENAIITLLSEDQKKACLIYINHPYNYKEREAEAEQHGMSRSNFYKYLDQAAEILDFALEPIENDELKFYLEVVD